MSEGLYINNYTLFVCVGALAAAAVFWKFLSLWLGTDRWEYGWCRNNHARRNRVTRDVQFLLWKPGEQGWAKGMWVDFGPGHEGDFFAWEEGSQMRPEMVTRKMQEEFFKEKKSE